jgi:hypothetical protein
MASANRAWSASVANCPAVSSSAIKSSRGKRSEEAMELDYIEGKQTQIDGHR